MNQFCSIRTSNGVYTEFGIDPYFTNTIFVFQVRCTWKNFYSFFGMRIGTIVIDNGCLMLLIWIGLHDMLAKCIVNVIIIVLNYIFSKLLIFKQN
ncbi:hypothetical protein B5E43_14340 [Flavonifractor sp. An100]|nr:hypothetical protein B5E43_14340 [Flavonifractor sp. An100]